MVDAILLAGGLSRRFGPQNKLLATIRGKPLFRHTLDLVLALRAEGRISGISLVYGADEVAALAKQAAESALRFVKNLHPEKGQNESIRLGVGASSACYYFFLPCDQPFLTVNRAARILAARRPGFIAEPRISAGPGLSPAIPQSPKVFSASFRHALLALPPGTHPRDLVNADNVIPVVFPSEDAAFFHDVDTAECICTEGGASPGERPGHRRRQE